MNNPYGDLSQDRGQQYAPTPRHHGQAQHYGQPPQYAPPQQYALQVYGQPQPPAIGYVSYGEGAAPPQLYQPAPSIIQSSELGRLEDDAQLWLLATAAGFWIGFGWLTGPLGWYHGSKIRRQYRALGHHPCASANWAWGLGVASTTIYGFLTLAIIAAVYLLLGVV